jgi:arylsulfatase A-like enzyme
MSSGPLSAYSRRSFLKSVGALGLGAALSPRIFGQSPAIIKKRPPNILLLTTDQWHSGAFSYRGNTHVYTPQSDRIAAGGVDFEQSYCTDPLCMPSRTTWLTGRMTVEHGVLAGGFPIEPEMIDFGQWMGDHGYDTAMFGKWHTPGRDPAKSFDLYAGCHPSGQYGDFSTAAAARAYLLGRGKESPFFLHVSLMNPHDICQTACLRTANGQTPLPPDVQLPPLPANFSARPPEPEAVLASVRASPRRLSMQSWDEADWRLYQWNYYRNCEMVDSAIEQILDALEASGEAENTLLAYTSDHGEGLGHHAMTAKSFLYEEAARVPLILSMPGRLPAGVAARQLTSGVDLFPTFCGVAGIPTPPHLLGENLVDVFENPGRARPTLITSASFGGWMARDNRYKLIDYVGSPTRQLFDLQEDPGETKNLIDNPALAGEVKELESARRALQDRLIPSSTLSPAVRAKLLPANA